jgi:hypothetical protein
MVAVLDHALRQPVVVDAFDECFASSVDGANNDFRGMVEAANKVVE